MIAVCLNDENESEGAISAFTIDATRLRPIYASTTGVEQRLPDNNNGDIGPHNPMRRSFIRNNSEAQVDDEQTKTTRNANGDGNNGENGCADPNTSTYEVGEAFPFKTRPKCKYFWPFFIV